MGTDESKPLYASKCSGKNLWQEYAIYGDRLEFHTLLGTMVIPFSNIEEVAVYPPVIKSLRLHLRPFRPALKLDLADFHEHLVLDKDSGLIHRVLFTPENPAGFKRVLDEALAKFRGNG